MNSRAIRRLISEQRLYLKESNESDDIFLEFDEGNIQSLKGLIIGPKDTPYENVFLYFGINIPDDYPFIPPKVQFLTPLDGHTRMHPNLYAAPTGKVCLSILGTWGGPGWSPKLNLMGVMKTIQSLLDDEPIRNEPGHQNDKSASSTNYTKVVRFRAYRAGVYQMLTRNDLPERFRKIITESFIKNFDWYIKRFKEYSVDDNKTIASFHGSETICYQGLIDKITQIKQKLT